jgi:hypothetical protein
MAFSPGFPDSEERDTRTSRPPTPPSRCRELAAACNYAERRPDGTRGELAVCANRGVHLVARRPLPLRCVLRTMEFFPGKDARVRTVRRAGSDQGVAEGTDNRYEDYGFLPGPRQCYFRERPESANGCLRGIETETKGFLRVSLVSVPGLTLRSVKEFPSRMRTPSGGTPNTSGRRSSTWVSRSSSMRSRCSARGTKSSLAN